MKYQMNDLGRIAEAFQKSGLRPAPGLIRQLHQAPLPILVLFRRPENSAA
jgi:hypothetical protein